MKDDGKHEDCSNRTLQKLSLLASELQVGPVAVPDQQSHLHLHLLGGEVGVGHDWPPEVVGQFGLGVTDEDPTLLDHELLGQHSHLSQQRVELLLATEALPPHLGRDVPEADVEGVHLLDHQLEQLGPRLHVLLHIEGQLVLLLYLPGHVAPPVALQVGPQLQDVDHPPALQVLVSHVQPTLVGGSLLVEEVVSVGTVGARHQSLMLAEEESRLERNHQSLMGVKGNGVHVLEGPDLVDELVTHKEGASEGSVDVVPHLMFFAHLPYLSDGVDAALHCRPHC